MSKKNVQNNLQIRIQYCLENRKSLEISVNTKEYSKNLAHLCMRNSERINHLSFDLYYGKMEMFTIYKLYPYIQFDDGIHWNVPYDEVTIEDFLRTFPQVEVDGLTAYANNVGGSGDLFDFMMHEWSHFFDLVQSILSSLNIDSPMDVLDWIGRIEIICKGMNLFGKSFAKRKERKPTIHFIRKYIQRETIWDLNQISKNLKAEPELMALILEESGYVSSDGRKYEYNRKVAEKIEQAKQKLLEKQMDKHGSDVNCYSMNCAVEQLNVDLLYYAVVMMEQGKLNEYDSYVQESLSELNEFAKYIQWDAENRRILISEKMPKDFDIVKESEIGKRIEKIRREFFSEELERVSSFCKQKN